MMFSHLPPELESDILSRLPATSLGQLQFTCKRWYALFKDPRFIKKNSQRKPAETQMVLKKNKSVYSFSFDFKGINKRYDQFVQFTGKLRSLKDSKDVEVSEIIHCEGLLLCKTKGSRLVVWNPCTGQTRWIIQSSKRDTMKQKYFLGYENKNELCHSYKILRFSWYENNPNPADAKLDMYEFDSDSWKVVDVLTQNWFYLCNLSVSLKGNTYWLDSAEEEGTLVNFISRFDFTTESFGRLALPFESDDDNDLVSVLAVFREEKLAVLHETIDYDIDFKLKIWMTKDEAKDLSWSEYLVVDFNTLQVNSMSRVKSFLVDEKTKRVMCCDTDDEDGNRIGIYIAGENIHKQVYREMTKESGQVYDPLMVSYVPSLVQIPAKPK